MKASLSNAKEPSSPNSPKVAGDNSKWIGHIEWLCVFSVLFVGYLWFTSPVKTAPQFYFRLSLLTFGVVGYVAIKLLKLRRSRDSA